jgi:phospholipid/cholesterol/gamma-HCH transport system permease protein
MVRFTDEAGVRSLPLVLMMGALTGLIMSFQTAISLRRMASDVFVVNVVVVSTLRELGPLLAAVILAGRTGSAYAAEIGTMKINEEISALVTMGIDPMTMLVLPRLTATLVALPGMALAFEAAAMVGMVFVMTGFGYTPEQIWSQGKEVAQLKDLFGGMVKAAIFGVAIAAIGCRAGLQTGHGPRAVGEAATTAVVGGIVATIIIDGIFASVFYVTGF